MPQIPETVPFTFDELYTNLSAKFADAGYDINNGSNVAQLVTSMAYLTSMLNVNTAVNINETILPLSTKRDTVLENARAIGYEIQHKQSYTYRLTITLSGSVDGSYTIPKYSVFKEGGKTYYYMGSQVELLNQVDGTQITLLVKEGTLYTYSDYPDTLSVVTGTTTDSTGVQIPQYFVDIPFIDIEENGIECYVTYFDDFGNLVTNEEWLKSDQFVIDKDLAVKNKFFRIDNIANQTPRIYFELSGVGNGLKVGTTVNINVLKTSGISGAMTDVTKPAGVTSVIPNIAVSGITLITEGTDEESLESIRTNAPKFYNSANRAVTASDYVSICNRQTSVNDTYVWGGDEELPKSPGHIWFSFLPSVLPRTFTSDIHNKEFLLDNDTYVAWDYTLDPVIDAAAYNAQLLARDTYYSSKYIEDSEIQSVEVNTAGQIVNPGVWDVLTGYKIPTLAYHNRHPIMIDFEYDISVMKYSAAIAKADTQQQIFNIVDNFFTGTNDPFQAEQFNVEYFHSSLEKRIDAYITDSSGYNNTITTKLMLSKKNVTEENALTDHRDVFIPLAVPFESHFDTNGYLLYSVLPSIDTLNFIDYRDNGVTLAGKPTPSRIYTDWSDVQAEIDATTTQINQKVIIAPIRTSLTETVVGTGGESAIALTRIDIFPDDPSTIDIGTPTYTKTTVTHIATNSTETVLVKGVDCDYDSTVSTVNVTLTTPLLAGESIRVDTEAMCGNYILFNGFEKYITIQLFVDATGYVDGSAASTTYTDPKSYLTTSDQLYDFTIDSFYLTTNGYTLTDPNASTVVTGPVIKAITPHTYTGSPIKMDLFRRNRYLDLNYNSPNFRIKKNLIPRLKRVTFN